jgi:small subunit ribosomal protein S3
MGQKVNPIGIRLKYNTTTSDSTWYAEGKEFADKLHADIKARKFIKEKLKKASVSKIFIERPAKNARIKIRAARPGAVIGKSGKDIDDLRNTLTKMLGVPVHINIEEVRKAAIDAQLAADNISQQLEKRVMFRRAMKRTVSSAMRIGALGIRVCVSGRLNGAEIARSEWYREGRVPLHTLRADIDYATSEALTTYGIIGVKVWIFKGEVTQNQLMVSKPVSQEKDSRK